MTTVTNVDFTVTFTCDEHTFLASYGITLPTHKRPTHAHISKKDGHIRGLSIRIKNQSDLNISVDAISNPCPTLIDSGLYQLQSYDTLDYVYLGEGEDVDEDADADEVVAEDEDVNMVAYRFAKSLRFTFALDSDPHAGCYCKTQSPCGCGCDPDHDGW